jgi:hypothetical protein
MNTPKICLLLLTVLLSCAGSLQATLINEKAFGNNCLVLSYIDDVTSLKSSILTCFNNSNSISDGSFQLACDNNNVTVMFDAGLHASGAMTRAVVFRFDAGQGFQGNWNYDGQGGVITTNYKNHKMFLKEIGGASRLEYEIDGTKGDMNLDGVSGASSEYIKRCAEMRIKVD